MLQLKNPIVLFVCTWLFVLLIYSRQYSLVLTTLSNDTILYVLLACSSFIFSYFIVRGLADKKIYKQSEYFTKMDINKTLKIVFIIWLIFTCLEIAYFRSLPLLALLGIGSGAYTEWGIPSLHGLLNAMIITLSNCYFYLYLRKGKKKYLYFFIACLCWPLILVTRQVFMSMAIQAVFIYILTHKIKLRIIVKVFFTAILVVYLFGLIGDLRTDPDSFIALAQPSRDYPQFLPSGFLWVYIYVTSPLNNVNFNITKFPNFNFQPVYVLSSFFPSFIRDKIFGSSNAFNFQLVNEYLNVSSMFPNYLSAFGYWGSILFYFLLGVIFSVLYFKTKVRRVNIKWIFILTVIMHNILFSVFVDFFSSLVFIFQIFLHYIIGTKIKIKDDKV